VRMCTRFGAIGLSRRESLMYKELRYPSLASVLEDYKQSYQAWWHSLDKIRVGLAVSHDTFSTRPVCWRYFLYKVSKTSWEKVQQKINTHTMVAGSAKLFEKWMLTGQNHTESQKSKRRSLLPETMAAYTSASAAKKVALRKSQTTSPTKVPSKQTSKLASSIAKSPLRGSQNLPAPTFAKKVKTTLSPEENQENSTQEPEIIVDTIVGSSPSNGIVRSIEANSDKKNYSYNSNPFEDTSDEVFVHESNIHETIHLTRAEGKKLVISKKENSKILNEMDQFLKEAYETKPVAEKEDVASSSSDSSDSEEDCNSDEEDSD